MNSLYSKYIWIDADPGIDDAIAIMLVGHDPLIKVLGISTVGANSTIDNVTRNALDILYVANLDIEVYQGSSVPLLKNRIESEGFHGKTGFGPQFNFPLHNKKTNPKNAILQMYETIIKQTEKVYLVALGPMTNYALLLKVFPDVKNYIKEIIFMGGSLGNGNISVSAEYNIYWDAEAAKIIFDSEIMLTMISWDLVQKTKFSEIVMNRIKDLKTKFGDLLSHFFSHLNNQEKKFRNKEYSMVCDAAVSVYLVKPEIFTKSKLMNAEIETKSEYCYGRTICDIKGRSKKNKNLIVLLDLQVEEYWKILMANWDYVNKISPLNKL